MDIVKMLLLTVLPAVVLACIVGIAVGKHQVKKAANQLRPLLSARQRVVFAASVLLGVTCVLVGIFYQPGGEVDELDMGMGMDEKMMDDFLGPGGNMENAVDAYIAIDPQDGGEFDGEVHDKEDGEVDGEEVDGEASDGEDEQADEQEEAAEPAVTARSSGGSGGVVIYQPRSSTGRAVRIG